MGICASAAVMMLIAIMLIIVPYIKKQVEED